MVEIEGASGVNQEADLFKMCVSLPSVPAASVTVVSSVSTAVSTSAVTSIAAASTVSAASIAVHVLKYLLKTLRCDPDLVWTFD